VIPMKTEDLKAAIDSMKELNENYIEAIGALRGTSQQVRTTKNLFRDGNKSRLIRIGLALIVFPEPTPISETVGACFVAAGAVQQGIKSRGIYLEDITKTLRSTLREIRTFKESVRI
jgi:hypothetical protein